MADVERDLQLQLPIDIVKNFKLFFLTLLLLGLGLELVFSDIFPTIAPDFYTNAGEQA